MADLTGRPRYTPGVERMLEADWQTRVCQLARLGGWTWYHTHDARRSPGGFPDLVLVRGSRLLFRELKKQDGVVTDEQRKWLELLTAAGQDAKVWRPSDLPEVIATLGRRAATPQVAAR